jgi:hypothetical protein
MKLDFVFVGEATAPQWALQVFGEVEHHAIGSVTTGKHSLMGSVDIVVVPHDDGELFSLHLISNYRLQGAGLAPHWVN